MERLIKSLRQLLQVANKTQEQMKGIHAKRAELQQENTAMQPNREARVKRTKQIQQELEKLISTKCLQSARPVNIYGAINSL